MFGALLPCFLTFILFVLAEVRGASASALHINISDPGEGTDRIVGGVVTAKHEFPYIVSIRNESDIHFCAGSIVGREWVLTAAHCVDKSPSVDYYTILAGAYDFQHPDLLHEQRVNVVEGWVHPKNNPNTGEYDLALFRVSPPFNLNGHSVTSISLPPPHTVRTPHGHFAPPRTAVVAGWGRLADGGARTPILHKVTIRLVDDDLCVEVYKHAPPEEDWTWYINPAVEVCYGAPGKDSCSGDSGGPLVATIRTGRGHINMEGTGHANGVCLVGIVSFGSGCASPGFPGVYVRVSAVTSWIQATMARNRVSV